MTSSAYMNNAYNKKNTNLLGASAQVMGRNGSHTRMFFSAQGEQNLEVRSGLWRQWEWKVSSIGSKHFSWKERVQSNIHRRHFKTISIHILCLSKSFILCCYESFSAMHGFHQFAYPRTLNLRMIWMRVLMMMAIILEIRKVTPKLW